MKSHREINEIVPPIVDYVISLRSPGIRYSTSGIALYLSVSVFKLQEVPFQAKEMLRGSDS